MEFCGIPFSMEEILFDPQTSGGLLIAAPSDSAEKLEKELQEAGLPARIVGELTEKGEKDITVYKEKKGMRKQVNALGDVCPVPVVKTKNAIKELGTAGGSVETLVDNEIAVQNRRKWRVRKGVR